MFAVVFEVQPKPDQWDAYLGIAGLLRPELLKIDGFLDNTRYRSRHRDGLVLSLSTWADEAALIRWRTHATHEAAQIQGRTQVFRDYRLRVGRIGQPPAATEHHVSLVTWTRPPETTDDGVPALDGVGGIQDRDLFEAILTPGAMLLLISWHAGPPGPLALPPGARRQDVAVIRDYGMFRRAQAPRFYPPV